MTFCFGQEYLQPYIFPVTCKVIIPFVVESSLMITTANFTVLRVLRLTRLFRLVKLGKSFEVLQIIGRVFHKSIAMFWVFAVNLSLALCFSAATIYFVEGGEWDEDAQTYIRTGHDGQKSVTPFQSIPHSFWWVFVTFTTVGPKLSHGCGEATSESRCVLVGFVCCPVSCSEVTGHCRAAAKDMVMSCPRLSWGN